MLGFRGNALRWLIGVVLAGTLIGGALGFGLRAANRIGAHTVSVEVDNRDLPFYACPSTVDSPQQVIGHFHNHDRVLATARDAGSAWLLTRSNTDVGSSVWVQAHYIASDATVGGLPIATCGEVAGTPPPSPTAGQSPTVSASPGATPTSSPTASPTPAPSHTLPPPTTTPPAATTVLSVQVTAFDTDPAHPNQTIATIVVQTSGTGAVTLNMDYYETDILGATSGVPDGHHTQTLSGSTTYTINDGHVDPGCPKNYEGIDAWTSPTAATGHSYKTTAMPPC